MKTAKYKKFAFSPLTARGKMCYTFNRSLERGAEIRDRGHKPNETDSAAFAGPPKGVSYPASAALVFAKRR